MERVKINSELDSDNTDILLLRMDGQILQSLVGISHRRPQTRMKIKFLFASVLIVYCMKNQSENSERPGNFNRALQE